MYIKKGHINKYIAIHITFSAVIKLLKNFNKQRWELSKYLVQSQSKIFQAILLETCRRKAISKDRSRPAKFPDVVLRAESQIEDTWKLVLSSACKVEHGNSGTASPSGCINYQFSKHTTRSMIGSKRFWNPNLTHSFSLNLQPNLEIA